MQRNSTPCIFLSNDANKHPMKTLVITLLLLCSTALKAQNCDAFEDTTTYATILTTQTTFTAPFYNLHGVSFRAKYDDPMQNGFNGTVVIDDHVQAGYTGSNGATNFAGNIFYQGWVITELDFSSFWFPSRQIEFDVNRTYSTINPFFANGAGENMLPNGVTCVITPLVNGSHVVMTGQINTLELHEHELAIDNLCVSELMGSSALGCNDFEGGMLYEAIPTTQTNYGLPYYVNGGVSFRSRYEDPLGMGIDGSAVIADHVQSGYTGSNGATNFAGNIFYQGWAVTELDFSGVGVTSMQIEFDVNRTYSVINPFRINGAADNVLPNGVSCMLTPLTDGSHVVITGPVSTLELHEHELAIDNLCVSDSITSSIADDAATFSARLYPNPTTRFLQIESDSPVDGVEIYGMNGQRFAVRFVSQRGVDLSDLANGLYLIRVRSGSEVSSQKILKQ